MSELFLKILNNSISAGWLVLAVMAFRIIFRKAPKWISCVLWGVVALRLICPVSLESPVSLIPSAETVSPGIIYAGHPAVDTGFDTVDKVVNPILEERYAPSPAESANPLQIKVFIWSLIWIAGAAVLLFCALVSYIRLKLCLRTAVREDENIFRSEFIETPFVMGIIKPVIYLPVGLNGREAESVIAHERTHIRHRDNISKPMGFLLLTVFWFDPLMWVAYILFCRDLEMCCDEAVISSLSTDKIADYSQALLSCSVRGRIINACPVAFGEIGVKARIRKVLNYKKPSFYVVIAAAAVCIIIAVCFMTDPKRMQGEEGTVNTENTSKNDSPEIHGGTEEQNGPLDASGSETAEQSGDGMVASDEEPIGFISEDEQPEKVEKFLKYWDEIKGKSELIKASGAVSDKDIMEKPEYELIRAVSFGSSEKAPSPILYHIIVAYGKEINGYSFFENGVICSTSMFSSNLWSGEYYLTGNIEEVIEKTKEITEQ